MTNSTERPLISVKASLAGVRSGRLSRSALAALALISVILLFHGTAADIVETWYTSSAFNHGFLIVPICLYLVWRRRSDLDAVEVTQSLGGVLVVGAGCLAWLLAHVTETRVIQQFGLVIVAQGVILTMYGWSLCRKLLFPLGYAFFAVPFGQALVPPLQAVTATLAVAILKFVGIPVFADGDVISVPNGTFYVAEACSGISFLIASMALGTLFAGIIYKSWYRRALFLGMSFVVPIVANGVRAFGIILIAYLTSNELAVGIDHIVYGWIFFSLIAFVLLAAGMSFRDTPALDPALPSSPRKSISGSTSQRLLLGGVIALAPVLLTALYGARLDQEVGPTSIALQPPVVAAPWHRMEQLPDSAAESKFADPDVELLAGYEMTNSQAYLHIGYYEFDRRGAQAVSSAQDFGGGSPGVIAEISTTTTIIEGRPLTVQVVRKVYGSHGHITWYWYWVDGRFTANPYFAKLLEARTKLFGGEQASAVIAVGADYDEKAGDAEKILRGFVPAIQDLSAVLRRASAK